MSRAAFSWTCKYPDWTVRQCSPRLSELGSTLPIIFLTGHPDIPTTVRAIKAGADDFLTKPVSSDELLRAIELAIVRHEARRGLKSRLDMVCARVSALTPREREVFELVVRGDTNKQVARALGCTERTIKAHRHRVMEKMQAQTLAELVSLAERVGVFESGAGQRMHGPDAGFQDRSLVSTRSLILSAQNNGA